LLTCMTSEHACFVSALHHSRQQRQNHWHLPITALKCRPTTDSYSTCIAYMTLQALRMAQQEYMRPCTLLLYLTTNSPHRRRRPTCRRSWRRHLQRAYEAPESRVARHTGSTREHTWHMVSGVYNEFSIHGHPPTLAGRPVESSTRSCSKCTTTTLAANTCSLE
jgi:hypothetical protein